MCKPLLSIIIPVAPNREDRLAAILSRLTLNKRLFPDHTFEVIICDGGATDNTRSLCETISKYMPTKYIYIPICRPINPYYPRNIAVRVCEGEVIGTIGVDDWPSEHLVYGMLNPFVHDSEFGFVQITEEGDIRSKIKDSYKEHLFGQYINGTRDVLNCGYLGHTDESTLTGVNLDQIPLELTHEQYTGIKIHDVFHYAKIPHGKTRCSSIWSSRREHVIKYNWYEKLKDHMELFDGQNFNFCAINMHHKETKPAKKRIAKNANWPWGKLLEYSFSVMGGTVREPQEHEEWINNNIKDVPSYLNSPMWKDINFYMEEIKKYGV